MSKEEGQEGLCISLPKAAVGKAYESFCGQGEGSTNAAKQRQAFFRAGKCQSCEDKNENGMYGIDVFDHMLQRLFNADAEASAAVRRIVVRQVMAMRAEPEPRGEKKKEPRVAILVGSRPDLSLMPVSVK